MESQGVLRRRRKVRLDAAIGQIYRDNRGDVPFLTRFDELLCEVRRRSRLFHPCPCDARLSTEREHMAAVEALHNLSRFHAQHRRSAATWKPSGQSARELVSSLATHLFGLHPTPLVLAKVWFGAESRELDRWRQWHIDHGHGTPFRYLCPRVSMTRRMEHFFLKSPPHLEPTAAIRRAEILALGGSARLASLLLETRLAHLTGNVNFWRSVVQFFIRNEERIDPHSLAQMVTYMDERRHGTVEVVSPSGRRIEAPRCPEFTVKGRSYASVLRSTRAWYRQVYSWKAGTRAWRPSGLQSLVYEEPTPETSSQPTEPTRWSVVELLDSQQLFEEGQVMRHCVAMYVGDCRSNKASIWSVRRRASSGRWRSVLTVQVDLSQRAVVQVQGRCNSSPRPRGLRVLRCWAKMEHLKL